MIPHAYYSFLKVLRCQREIKMIKRPELHYCAQLLNYYVLCRRGARFESLKHFDMTSWPCVWVFTFQMIVTIRHVTLRAIRRSLVLYTYQEQNVRHSIKACSIKKFGFLRERQVGLCYVSRHVSAVVRIERYRLITNDALNQFEFRRL